MTYDPTIGKWISEDPIGFAAGDGNLSRYVGNSAWNKVDPTGLQEVKINSAHSQRFAYFYDRIRAKEGSENVFEHYYGNPLGNLIASVDVFSMGNGKYQLRVEVTAEARISGYDDDGDGKDDEPNSQATLIDQNVFNAIARVNAKNKQNLPNNPMPPVGAKNDIPVSALASASTAKGKKSILLTHDLVKCDSGDGVGIIWGTNRLTNTNQTHPGQMLLVRWTFDLNGEESEYKTSVTISQLQYGWNFQELGSQYIGPEWGLPSASKNGPIPKKEDIDAILKVHDSHPIPNYNNITHPKNPFE